MSKCPNCFYEFDSWNECVAINNILECPECEEHFELKAVSLNQPQLTNPKRIADALDVGDLLFLAWTHANDLRGKVSDDERYTKCLRRNAIAKAYLAGKTLGVELVKVVDE